MKSYQSIFRVLTNLRDGRCIHGIQAHELKGCNLLPEFKGRYTTRWKRQRIYYFSKDQRPEGCELPAGFVVNENPRNGFLTVKRK